MSTVRYCELRIVVPAAVFAAAQVFGASTMAAPLALYDREAAGGTVMAAFSVTMTDPTPNGTFNNSASLYDSDSLAGSVTHGYPMDWSWVTPSPDTYARSTVDFTNGRISSELQYNYASPVSASNVSRIDVYTKELPSSYALAGDQGSYNSRFLIQVFDGSSSNLGQLGFMILSLINGSYQQHVTSSNDLAHETPLYDWQWINASEIPTSSDLSNHANWIVNGRTSDYYYQVGAEVSSSDSIGGHYSATLDWATGVPEPASMLAAVVLGSVALARRTERRRRHA